MTEEQKKNKEYHKGFLQRNKESIANYQRLSREQKRDYIKKILCDYPGNHVESIKYNLKMGKVLK